MKEINKIPARGSSSAWKRMSPGEYGVFTKLHTEEKRMPPEGTLAAFSCRLALVDGYLNHLSELDRRPIHRGRLVSPVLRRGQQLRVIHRVDRQTKGEIYDAALLIDDDLEQPARACLCGNSGRHARDILPDHQRRRNPRLVG